MSFASRTARSHRAFTLVEVLIVVLIIGILAALVVPQFSSAARTSRESALRDDLRNLRTQIMVYRAQHNGVSPGFPGGDPSVTPTFQAFSEQMTRYSDAAGQTSPTPSPRFKFGPYLTAIPVNAIIGSADIRFLAAGEAFPTRSTGQEGWIYCPSTAVVAANAPGLDSVGQPYLDY